MKNDIPHIHFSEANTPHSCFDIVPLERIAADQAKQLVDPEKPHQLKFYNLIFFTHGATEHFIDFKWYPVQQNTLVYLTKDQINAFRFTPDLQGYCLIFTEEYFVRSFSHLPTDFMYRLFNPQLFSPTLETLRANTTMQQNQKYS